MKKFTLVELLVVVAIIGILMSLLLPSLMRAREVTKTAVCLSNNAQINQAMQVYISKNDNRLPYDSRIHDTWPSFFDPMIGGDKFTVPKHTTKPIMSDIWGACPNSPNKLRDPIYFRDGDYAGVFPRSLDWPLKAISIINNPSSSAIITEGNHEAATQNLGNSWIRVGNNTSDNEYNKVTGKSWGRIRHDYQKKFTISSFDYSAKAIRWINRSSFSSKYGAWVNEY
jgi:prepilin-type N-terminal cleavage/methylation domain-containing protein